MSQKASKKSTCSPQVQHRLNEPTRRTTNVTQDDSFSDDVDLDIVDPKKSKKASSYTPKVTVPRSLLSRQSIAKPSVSFVVAEHSDSDFEEVKKPSSPVRRQSVAKPSVSFISEHSDSDFEEEKKLYLHKVDKSHSKQSKVHFQPKVVVDKLDLGSLAGQVAQLSNLQLESSSSSSYDSEDETSSEDSSDEDQSPVEKEKVTTRSHRTEESVGRPASLPNKHNLPVQQLCGYSMTPFDEPASYNYEAYFLANSRIKYKKETFSPPSQVPNDCRKGVARRPRKGTRGLGGAPSSLRSLPSCPIDSNFSVTKEAGRAASSFISQQTRHQIDTDESDDESLTFQCINDHTKEIQSYMKRSIESQFPRWVMLMREGFNVIIHGYGSKILIFDRFKSFLGKTYLLISVNGLYSKLNARSFLVSFCDALDLDQPIKISGTDLELIADYVTSELKTLDRPPDVFLLLMHFDSIAINHPVFLNILCTLAKLKWIHILASSDKVNASLGLTQAHAAAFNFCWFPCSTFLPYRQELTWNPNVFGDQSSTSGGGGKQTLQYVLKSLTTNARKAFTILASMQLANSLKSPSSNPPQQPSNDDSSDGVEFSALLRRCRESFVAHSDAALKALLVEFIDHKLINQGKTKAIGNILRITLDRETLHEIASGHL